MRKNDKAMINNEKIKDKLRFFVAIVVSCLLVKSMMDVRKKKTSVYGDSNLVCLFSGFLSTSLYRFFVSFSRDYCLHFPSRHDLVRVNINRNLLLF